MTVSRPCYATREQVKRALDIVETSRSDDQIDRAIQGGSEEVDGLCHRRFWTATETAKWDWPNFQRAYPWRIWFDERELADTTAVPPVVTVMGTGVIPDSAILFGPANYAPPFTYMELDRSQSYAFGGGPTPQRNVSVQGQFGYWTKATPAGSLGAAVSSSSVTTVQVTDAAAVGVGDVLIAGTEKMLVTGRSQVSTGVTFTGLGSASNADNVLAVPDGTVFSVGEVLLADSEKLLITDIAGNNLILKRAWDGTVLTAHTSGTLYASRLLTVTRGDFGSTAATYTQGTALSIAAVPGLVNQLALAEALNTVLQETTGYARQMAMPGAGAVIPGGSLPDLRDKVLIRYGRKHRSGVV